jgi:hypothetical protein
MNNVSEFIPVDEINAKKKVASLKKKADNAHPNRQHPRLPVCFEYAEFAVHALKYARPRYCSQRAPNLTLGLACWLQCRVPDFSIPS